LSKYEKFPVIEDHNIPQNRIDKKRTHEKITFLALARIYCKAKKHQNREDYSNSGKLSTELQEKVNRFSKKYPGWKHLELCPQCFEMVVRAEKHASRCPHMAYKTFCHSCPLPCYSKSHLEEIAQMMRFSGPRLMLHNPLIALRYIREAVKARNLHKKCRCKS
jgi:hypothetical protein